MLRIGARHRALSSDALPTPVLLVGSVMSLALLGDSLLYVALPAHAAELSLPLWSVGVLLGANRIVRLVTNGLAARLFSRVGGRGPMVAASIGSVVTTATYGLLPTFRPLLLARLGWGACFSTLRLGAFTATLAASQPSTRGRLVGLYQSISRVGPVGSLLVGGLLVETLGYHADVRDPRAGDDPGHRCWRCCCRRAAYLPKPHARCAPGRRSRRLPRAATAPPSLGWRERWLGGPRLVAVKLGMLANGFTSQGVVLATLTLALDRRRRHRRGRRRDWRAAGGVSLGRRPVPGALVRAPLGSDRAGPHDPGPAGRRGGRRGRAGAGGGPWAVIAATLAVFLTSTALTAASDAAAGDLAPPDRRAEVMSGYSDWIDIGAALGPPLAFMLADRLGLWPSYGCTAVLILLAAGWFMTAWRREAPSQWRDTARL